MHNFVSQWNTLSKTQVVYVHMKYCYNCIMYARLSDAIHLLAVQMQCAAFSQKHVCKFINIHTKTNIIHIKVNVLYWFLRIRKAVINVFKLM